VVAVTVSWIAISEYFDDRQEHYSLDKAVAVVDVCEAYRLLSGHGQDFKRYLRDDPYRGLGGARSLAADLEDRGSGS